MRRLSFPLLIVAALLMAACTITLPGPDLTVITGSGNTVSQTYDFSNFDGVEIGHAFQAQLAPGDGYSVEVTVDDNLVEHLRVEQQGDVVSIGFEPGVTVSRGTQQARITLPVLTYLEASGATRVNLSGFRSSEDLRLNVSGASTVTGDIEGGDLAADVSGASTLRLNGSGGSADVVASGASTADLSNFSLTNATVEASGASRINVDVSGTLNAEASGASSVRYTGNPTVERSNSSGGSSIQGQ